MTTLKSKSQRPKSHIKSHTAESGNVPQLQNDRPYESILGTSIWNAISHEHLMVSS